MSSSVFFITWSQMNMVTNVMSSQWFSVLYISAAEAAEKELKVYVENKWKSFTATLRTNLTSTWDNTFNDAVNMLFLHQYYC